MLFSKGYISRCLRIDFYSVVNPDTTPFLTISPEGFNGSEKIMKHPIIYPLINKLLIPTLDALRQSKFLTLKRYCMLSFLRNKPEANSTKKN
jgi:hypothetical protein